MRICPKCSHENSNNSRFCEQCGEILIGGKSPAKNKTRIVPVAIGTITIVIVAAVAVIIFTKRIDRMDSSETATIDELNQPSELDEKSEAEYEMDTTDSEIEQNIDTEQTTDSNLDNHSEEEWITEDNDMAQIAEKESDTHTLPSSIPYEFFVYNGHTYGFYDAEIYGLNTYRDVADFCIAQGGHLAVINDQAENNYLFGLVRDNIGKTAFFGYSDELNEGVWLWEYDGSDCYYDNWTIYGHIQPDNYTSRGVDEDYAEFNYGGQSPNDGTWNDASFRHNTNWFICEWEYDVVEAQQR